MNITVNDNPDRGRYEATAAGDGRHDGGAREGATSGGTTSDNGARDREVTAFADYSVQGRLVVITHTEVDPAYEGQGIGSTLVRAALDDIRRQGRRVVPVCPFVRTWIERHPDYADLTA